MRLAPFAVLFCAAVPLAALGEACVSPLSACVEWLELAGGRFKLFRSHALTRPNESITHAMVVIHGQNRDADNYFRHGLAGAFLANALDRAIVVSPHFKSTNGNCKDKPEEGELAWGCSGPQRWTSGGPALGGEPATSFDVMDALLRRLADRRVFPNLRHIVMAGHSAGGQFVARYQLANNVHETLGVPLRYVVANPSSYTYPESLRPARATDSEPAPKAAFGRFGDARNCTGFDDWPFGLQKRVGYAASVADDELRRRLASRPATYLLGELDTLPLYGFDDSCPAMAQGATRLARGLSYHRFVAERLGAKHDAVVVPACGHNARCMFGAEKALPVLFPRD